jgi:hypothetical protein
MYMGVAFPSLVCSFVEEYHLMRWAFIKGVGVEAQ